MVTLGNQAYSYILFCNKIVCTVCLALLEYNQNNLHSNPKLVFLEVSATDFSGICIQVDINFSLL